jgi:hypothetical protein
MKPIYLLALFVTFGLAGCSSSSGVNDLVINKIPEKTTHVAEEKPDKYPHPPEDLRSVVGKTGWYHSGGYYYPSRSYYNRYYNYYRYH